MYFFITFFCNASDANFKDQVNAGACEMMKTLCSKGQYFERSNLAEVDVTGFFPQSHFEVQVRPDENRCGIVYCAVIFKNPKKISEALEAILTTEEVCTLDCRIAAHLSTLNGLRKALGDTIFDRFMGKIHESTVQQYGDDSSSRSLECFFNSVRDSFLVKKESLPDKKHHVILWGAHVLGYREGDDSVSFEEKHPNSDFDSWNGIYCGSNRRGVRVFCFVAQRDKPLEISDLISLIMNNFNGIVTDGDLEFFRKKGLGVDVDKLNKVQWCNTRNLRAHLENSAIFFVLNERALNEFLATLS